MADHRAYQPIKPAASRMLAKRWDDSAYSKHQKKLRNTKATVDNKPPKTYMHLQLKLKKLQLEEERMATVERDNRMLLEKMSTIMRTTGRVDNHNDYSHKSLNKAKREQDLLRITHENQAILKRISSKAPHYDRHKWERDYDQSRRLQGQIARYPKPGHAQAHGRHGDFEASGQATEAKQPTKASASTAAAAAAAEPGVASTAPASTMKEALSRIFERDASNKELLHALNDPNQLTALWRQCDFNGNGGCSLAEIDKLVTERGLEVAKPALLRAYKKTTLVDGVNNDAWVERREFRALLRNILLFGKLWDAFDDLDADDDRRIDQDEFTRGLQKLGCPVNQEEAAAAFADADQNGGGKILFKEFCDYVASTIGVRLEDDDAKWAASGTSKTRAALQEEQAAA
ncbi:uncharacterized protein MONBRDRAFT_38031 [Monosiga brevicollis MX1]|uniref:EF-hand domain-containing protein n=1 Tax=Monosiga brevicollis TaxID=81824 RepID=A9V5A6_MONBE|nr:uncharacterized protein MONBRDRAFT_38031 [Monosiga brevicollis MX1]EDQ87244.1 predicted protein [Monosiga brevicollis MX1]|eukprot:XP_001747857.1 hypothetical protein [Monosiga brevicollis MX1]